MAGEAALIVSKVHKIGDRTARPNRLKDKDAADTVRLFMSSKADQIADRFALLLNDERSAAVTRQAIDRLDPLFGTPRSLGTEMAVRALQGALPRDTVAAVCLSFVTDLRRRLKDAGLI